MGRRSSFNAMPEYANTLFGHSPPALEMRPKKPLFSMRRLDFVPASTGHTVESSQVVAWLAGFK
ncbi:hypothetical protein AAVH_34040 [Aphelenchoides avenae]|nr:hypothetical protein AAVH_34040 [Aphelenchus avenae]